MSNRNIPEIIENCESRECRDWRFKRTLYQEPFSIGIELLVAVHLALISRAGVAIGATILASPKRRPKTQRDSSANHLPCKDESVRETKGTLETYSGIILMDMPCERLC